MSRKSQIKWRRSDEEELKRAVKNFNNKLSRIMKKNPQLAEYLPERKSYEAIKDDVSTRQQLHREINSLKRFTNRKNVIKDLGNGNYEGIITSKTGLRITSWEKKEVGIQVGIINRERTRKKKELESEEATSRGKSLKQSRSQMQSIRMNELNKKVFNFDKIKKSDWQKYKATVKRQSHPDFQSEADENLRKNYLKGLIEVFGDTDKTKKLIENIEAMPLKDFITKFYKEQEATVDFIYDPIEADRKFRILEETVWNYEEPIETTKKGKKKKKYKRKKSKK